MGDQLKMLEMLTRMKLDAELSRLRDLSEEVRRRRDEIAALGSEVRARSDALSAADPETDLALQTGQDARWQLWVARESSRLSRAAAEVSARREAQRRKAERAFGQVHALGKIREIGAEEKRLCEARRLQGQAGRGEAE